MNHVFVVLEKNINIVAGLYSIKNNDTKKIKNIKTIEILDDFIMILRISSFSKHCKIVKTEIGNIMLLFKASNIKAVSLLLRTPTKVGMIKSINKKKTYEK